MRRTLIAGAVGLSFLKIFTYFDYLDRPYLTENDLSPDYVSAREWRDGGNPYDPLIPMYERVIGANDLVHHFEPHQRNAHPPGLILFFVPLTIFGFSTARAVWLVAMIAATFLAVFVFARELDFPRRVAAALALLALTLPVVSYDLRWAQINGLLLLGFVVAWRDLRKGNERRAGIILGIATALKIFPWLLLIPLVRLGRRRAAGWLTGTAVVVSVVSALIIGLDSSADYFRASSDNQDIWSSAPHSISLVSAPFRWGVPDNWNDPTLPVPAVLFILAAAAFALCVWAAVRTRADASEDLFWATIPWVILASPIAWAHYLVLMLPLPLLIYCRRSRLGRSQLRLLSAALVVVLMGTTSVVWVGTVFGSLRNHTFQLAAVSVLMLALIACGVLEFGKRTRRLARSG